MSDSKRADLAPSYHRDLRELVRRAFASPSAIPASPIPGGPLDARVAADLETQSGMVRLAGGEPAAEGKVVAPQEYWPIALPHHVLALGPLLKIGSSALPRSRRIATERHLLAAYRDRYDAMPLPPDLLRLIRDNHGSGGGDLQWLCRASTALMGAPTVETLRKTRSHLRLEVVRRMGYRGWTERATCTSELTIDMVTLCRATALDVESAERLAPSHGGSVSEAVGELDERQDLAFEAILPDLVRGSIPRDSLDSSELLWIESLAASREPLWVGGFLASPQGAAPEYPAPKAPSAITVKATRKPPPSDAEQPEQAKRAAPDVFQGLVKALESRIIARPRLCRELALTGTCHLLGVAGQRLLLCGASGSGKSHSAQALAEVLEDRDHLIVSVGDLSQTGFKGGQINDVLDGLNIQGKKSEPGVLVLNEVDKARIIPGSTSNSRSAQIGLQVSLMELLDGQPATPEYSRGEQIETDRLLVIGTGAFEGQFTSRPPTTDDLVSWGWAAEFASRWGQRICLTPMSRSEAWELLRSSNRAPNRRLQPLLQALDLQVRLSDHVLRYTVERWMSAGCDYRTASEWLLAATRSRIIQHLEGGGQRGATLEITPDDLPFFSVGPSSGGG